VLSAFLAYTVTLVSMVKGLTSADESTLELMHTLHARRPQELLLVRLPSALPYLFTALKLSASAAVVAAIAAEYIGSLEGLGYLIEVSGRNLQNEYLWGTVVVAGIIGMSSYGVIAIIERRVLHWQPDGDTGLR
jgi:ABC-type nitrate/sulfonate/bicarbonate transport system permease component